jgi:hypothetical protein
MQPTEYYLVPAWNGSEDLPNVLDAKLQNIVDMALTFTATIRVFRKGSKGIIAGECLNFLADLSDLKSREDYDKRHRQFCMWFARRIETTGRKGRNGKKALGASASFGQAAKIIDLVAKVYVHYCRLPSPKIAKRVLPFLHCAIDTPIMKYLKAKYRVSTIRASTIQAIDESTYRELQKLVARDIKNRRGEKMSTVAWDDVMWRRLNRDE